MPNKYSIFEILNKFTFNVLFRDSKSEKKNWNLNFFVGMMLLSECMNMCNLFSFTCLGKTRGQKYFNLTLRFFNFFETSQSTKNGFSKLYNFDFCSESYRWSIQNTLFGIWLKSLDFWVFFRDPICDIFQPMSVILKSWRTMHLLRMENHSAQGYWSV